MEQTFSSDSEQPDLESEDEEYNSENNIAETDDLIEYCKSLKNNANESFRTQNFREAKGLYSEALAYVEFFNAESIETRYEEYINLKVTLLLNLVACLLKLDEFEDALTNSDKALDIINKEFPTSQTFAPFKVKAYYRKAQALRNLENYEDANSAIATAIQLSPDNQQLKDEQTEIATHLEEQQKEGKKRQFSLSDIFSGLFGGKKVENENKKSKKNDSDIQKELLNSGAFGGPPSQINTRYAISRRERNLNGFSHNDVVNITHKYIPNTRVPDKVASFTRRVYCGEYSDDGNLFVSASQDWKVRIYDTSRGKFKPLRTVTATQGQWTLTDACLSRDSSMLIYSSIIPVAHLYKIDQEETKQDFLDFSTEGDSDFGIWSLRFSADCREVIAGTSNNCLYVYNIERKDVEKYKGHKDEVNAVCFSDKDNTNIILTGSDDNQIFVWDRRTSTSKKGKPNGVLTGHTEGLTYLCPKGDGRYILSNAKDQTMKLWDLRKMIDNDDYRKSAKPTRQFMWDYRSNEYPGKPGIDKHPNDLSVQTFVGHKVLRTLIRCRFSPEQTTGQRYVYSGSQDGKVVIYDLSGKIVQTLTTSIGSVVRDVSWHDAQLVASSWDGTLYKFSCDR